MATNESSRGGGAVGGFLNAVGALVIIAVALGIGYTMVLPKLLSTPLPSLLTLPTAGVSLPAPGSVVIPRGNSLAAPTASYAQVEATSQAIYHATVEAVPIQNVNVTGDVAPVVREQKQSAIEPAQGIVPTAEPLPQTDTGGAFGSKRVIVNPQETHTCLHGQIWVDRKGCKNPTPTP